MKVASKSKLVFGVALLEGLIIEKVKYLPWKELEYQTMVVRVWIVEMNTDFCSLIQRTRELSN